MGEAQSVIKDILLIDSVQRWATSFIYMYENNDLSYKDRVQKLDLLPINKS